MKKLIIAAVAAVVLVGCADTSRQTQDNVVVFDDEAYTNDDYQLSNEDLLYIMQEVWNETPYTERDSICYVYNLDPALSYEAFSEGAGDTIVPYSVFRSFFSGVC